MGLDVEEFYMPNVVDRAPDFTVPLAEDGIESFTLSDSLEAVPIVLAFFPAAFTGTCTSEMRTFQERLDAFHDAGATVYGISVDSPFVLEEFRDRHGIEFGLLSDFEKTVIDDYGVRTDFSEIGVYGLAKRSVFVVDRDRRIAYRWVTDDPGEQPDYDAVLAATEEATGR